MATIKVFSPDGVKELNCFDTIDTVSFLDDMEDEEIVDDGELTIGNPL